MNCPSCYSTNVLHRQSKTKRGLSQYQSRHCSKYFNERTGTPYNYIHYPTDIIVLVVFFYCRYKLSLVDLTEIMALRGIYLSHQTIHQWVQRFGSELGRKCRVRRWKQVGSKWHMDITYLKVKGHEYYLYRAIDKAGNLVDVYLSDTRDGKAARRFFTQCATACGIIPVQITTDKESCFKNAIKDTLGESVYHRDVKYLNNRMEQNHRGVKSWYHPMKGFKDPWSAMISCHAFEELRQFFRHKKSLAKHRGIIASRFQELLIIAQVAA